jgi:hypothetical protein
VFETGTTVDVPVPFSETAILSTRPIVSTTLVPGIPLPLAVVHLLWVSTSSKSRLTTSAKVSTSHC